MTPSINNTRARADIALCIRRCTRAQDGRGLWQAERSLQLALTRSGSAAVAVQVSGAARRIGQWLAGQGVLPAADGAGGTHAPTVGASPPVCTPTQGGSVGNSIRCAGDAAHG